MKWVTKTLHLLLLQPLRRILEAIMIPAGKRLLSICDYRLIDYTIITTYPEYYIIKMNPSLFYFQLDV